MITYIRFDKPIESRELEELPQFFINRVPGFFSLQYILEGDPKSMSPSRIAGVFVEGRVNQADLYEAICSGGLAIKQSKVYQDDNLSLDRMNLDDELTKLNS